MLDLAREGYDAILESIQTLIDKKKELLNNEKSLYEYQQSIASKTKNIASLQKQKAVYENDSSEEAKKHLQQITLELATAEQELKDAEYDKYITDQQEMLDKMYQEYSDKIDEKFENTDAMLANLISVVNEKSSIINSTISSAAKDVGYTISTELSSIWNSNTSNIIVSDFSRKFTTYSTTIQDLLSKIGKSIDSMANTAQKEAKSTTKDISTSNAKSTSTKEPEILPDGQIVVYIEKTNRLLQSELLDLTKLTNLVDTELEELLSVDALSTNSNLKSNSLKSKLPDLSSIDVNSGADVQFNIENINLPNVTKPEEFSDAFVTAMKHDTKITMALRSVTTDALAGKSTKRLNIL